jgi:hypothetical protein
MPCAVYFPFVWFCVARSKIIQSFSFSASSCRTMVSLGLDPFWPRAPVFTVRIFFSYFASPRFRFLVSCFILPSSFVRCFVHPRSRANVGQLPPCFLAVSCGTDFVLSFFELPVGRMSSMRPGLFSTQHFGAHPITTCEPVSWRVTSCLYYFLQFAACLGFFHAFALNRA